MQDAHLLDDAVDEVESQDMAGLLGQLPGEAPDPGAELQHRLPLVGRQYGQHLHIKMQRKVGTVFRSIYSTNVPSFQIKIMLCKCWGSSRGLACVIQRAAAGAWHAPIGQIRGRALLLPGTPLGSALLPRPCFALKKLKLSLLGSVLRAAGDGDWRSASIGAASALWRGRERIKRCALSS